MTRDQALVNSLQFQRNALADELANRLADLAVANSALEDAQARIAELEQVHERLAALEQRLPIDAEVVPQ